VLTTTNISSRVELKNVHSTPSYKFSTSMPALPVAGQLSIENIVLVVEFVFSYGKLIGSPGASGLKKNLYLK